MLIEGQKWACEACIRGHRVTSCKHHDRPLIRIKRKGRPFATCTICHATPCAAPVEHSRQKRDAELKCPKKTTHARLYPRHHNPHGFTPIAPRPAGKDRDAVSTRMSRSGSTSASSSHTPVRNERCSRDAAGSGDWSGSEGSSGAEDGGRAKSNAGMTTSSYNARPAPVPPLSRSAPDSFVLDSVLSRDLFDPMYSLLPSSSMTQASTVQTVPLLSPLERANPFDIPLDPALTMNDASLGYLDNMDVDVTAGVADDVFHVEDWSRYMWSPETGFEHLDSGLGYVEALESQPTWRQTSEQPKEIGPAMKSATPHIVWSGLRTPGE
ncbi:hypothetical protein N7492_008133 [Penicillium capsulatum]|uniref:Copper-fist domain-containing protein n=1 Tax=Penicillium capsulatum TaxID=69766 RepID=A0A9W9HS06_9EURO|nr:hypothetical protein N7492_008133 [Penicillium capsulatum]KAJ6105544.1 hypothetical protein N7512_009061 [Penicillium capsulatum]